MNVQVIVVAGGNPELWPNLQQISSQATIWVGVDRGSLLLLEHGLQPTIAIGDFDSLRPEELKLVEKNVEEIHYAKAEKEDTDTQLALETIFSKYPTADVILIGTTGGRMDHLLANLWLPLEPRFIQKIQQIQMRDQQNTICYFSPGKYQVVKEANKKYIAFICLTPVAHLSLAHVKYPLKQRQVEIPTSFASNEFIGDMAEFSFDTGIMAVIQSADK